GAHIKVAAQEGAGDEPGGGNEAGRVIVLDEIVVDGLGGVDEGEVGAGLIEDLKRAGSVVAANIDEGGGGDAFQPREDVGAIGGIGLVARAAEGGAGRGAETVQIAIAETREVDEFARTDAPDTVSGAEHLATGKAAARLDRGAGNRLIDDRGWAAALGDDKDLVHRS